TTLAYTTGSSLRRKRRPGPASAVLATPEATMNRITRQPARRRASWRFQNRPFMLIPPGPRHLTPGFGACSADLETTYRPQARAVLRRHGVRRPRQRA